jgi:hypothetical protein
MIPMAAIIRRLRAKSAKQLCTKEGLLNDIMLERGALWNRQL